MLTDAQLLRYNRQILMHDFDIDSQEKLLAAHVVIVGLGGLGCPAALYLGAAGVGRLTLVDGDDVELSNLQRQIAHGEADIGRNKAVSAAQAVARVNPQVTLQIVDTRLNERAFERLLDDGPAVDLVIDASDNYPIRYAMNRACIGRRIPLVSGAAVRAEGQVAVFYPAAGGPCYRCLYPVEGEVTALSCSASGVLAPTVGVVGSLLASEALKLVTGYGETLTGRVLMLDLRSMEQQTLTLHRRVDCPDCAHEHG